MGYHSTQETRAKTVEDDVAGIVFQAQVMCIHLNIGTRVYNVEDDVAGNIRQALHDAAARGGGGRGRHSGRSRRPR